MHQRRHLRLPLFADANGRFSFHILRFAWQVERQARNSISARFRASSNRLQAVRIIHPAKPATGPGRLPVRG